MSEPKKGNRSLLVIIVVLLVVIAVLVVMLFGSGDGEMNEPPAYTDGGTGEETMITENPGVPVENPYMTYYCPADLEDAVTVRQTTGENRHEAIFVADISGQELELFSVILGTAAEETGFELGVLEDASLGTVHVTLVMNEQQAEDWSEEDFNRINALQERINDIIAQFHEDPRFKANR